jgi:hypothetical protein
MVDRRKFIVGGGAAALAATLAATATGGPATAAPRRVFTTEDHARRVLELVDVEKGLVSPSGFPALFDWGWDKYLASPPRDPKADDLEAWVRVRIMDLCRTDSFADALTKIPQTRSLLAFSVVMYSQDQTIDLPEITRSMPVPEMMSRLEPDFFPVFVDLINERSGSSREFATALDSAITEVDRLVEEKLREAGAWEDGMGAQASPRGGEILEGMLAFGFFCMLYYSAKRALK